MINRNAARAARTTASPFRAQRPALPRAAGPEIITAGWA